MLLGGQTKACGLRAGDFDRAGQVDAVSLGAKRSISSLAADPMCPESLISAAFCTGYNYAQLMGLTSGTKLGPYEIVAPLGAGGMGEVYRARDTRLDRTVAVKVLSSHLSENPEARQRFDREARAIRR